MNEKESPRTLDEIIKNVSNGNLVDKKKTKSGGFAGIHEETWKDAQGDVVKHEVSGQPVPVEV